MDQWDQVGVCRPKATVRVHAQPGVLKVTSEDVIIEGSKEVVELDLPSRCAVDVCVDVKELTTTSFHASARLDLAVDVPFPFSMTPKGVLEVSGNAVVNALLSALMPVFSKIMVSDIEGEYRP
jgi:hypothetical protein